MIRTHKIHGWTRQPLGDGSSRHRITPTDASGERIVAFMSAHSWANYANDNRANATQDRIVLLDGPELPEWAVEWLTKANARSCENGRANLRAAIEDADNNDPAWRD